MFYYEVYARGGGLLRYGEATTRELAEIQGNGPDEIVQVFQGDDYTPPVIERRIVVGVDDIKREQRRRLSYTDGYIVRAADPDDGRPVPEWVISQRRAIREGAIILEAMTPIPPDYRDEKYWT